MAARNPWKIFGNRIRKRQYAKKEFPNIASGSKRDAARFMLEADGKFDGLLSELFENNEILVTTATDLPKLGIKVVSVEYKGVEFSGSYNGGSQCELTFLSAWKKAGKGIDVQRDKQLFMLNKISTGRYAFEGEMGLEDYERLAKPYLESPDISLLEGGMVKVNGEIGKREAIGQIVKKLVSY